LAGVPRSKIREQLAEVGFDDERQAEIVGGLSGGWKMKLELARAMLYNADVLLLDEVSVFLLCNIWLSLTIFSFMQPTNHVSDLLGNPTDLTNAQQLDRASVSWLEQYLTAQKNITCLIVSHDSGYVYIHTSSTATHKHLSFLDNVTTDIMHYESKKVC
jgi:elongation factor 3